MTNNYCSNVDPFIAVNWPGNGLCGPYLPYSLVRLSPDTLGPTDTTGYRSGQPIKWFSHTHVAGTGGSGRYGNIGVVPFTGPLRAYPEAGLPQDEQAACGYYAVTLQPSGIRAELTSTPRVGVHRYTFPAGAEAHLLIDAGAVVQVGGGKPGLHTGGSTGGFIEIISPTEVVGRGDFRGGWGHSFPYAVYFYARLDSPARGQQVGTATGMYRGAAADGANCRALLSFGPVRQLQLKVGISLVSLANARASVEHETQGADFDAIRRKAEAAWDKTLSRLAVEGGAPVERKLFYTAFARLLCLPTDLGIDDENPAWKSGVRQFSEFYCLWDSVRNANSLLGLFDPETEAAFLNGLLDVADHIGWIPDAWIAGHSAQIQGGSSADVLFCEANLKGFSGIDYAKALAHMRRNAEVESPDPKLYGRYLKEYRERGYLSTNVPQGASRHVEYAYQDWCIGTLASRLGQSEIARQYWESSRKVWNLWRDDLKSIAPRLPDGRWVEGFDPHQLREDCWADPYFYEGSGMAWSCNIQHDLAGLVARTGGADAFLAYLDRFFVSENKHPWKEIVLHLPYLYTYAGRPEKTALQVREMLNRHYRPTRDGLDDNEDMGCQSAFYMCSSMGLYPIMGQDLYMLTTPLFERTQVGLGGTGRTLTIENPNASSERPFIVSATLNGKPLERAWLRHEEIAGGATLRVQSSARFGEWGRQPPPSPLA